MDEFYWTNIPRTLHPDQQSDKPAGGNMQILAKLNLSIAQTKIRYGISDLDYVGIHYFRQCLS